MLTRVIERGVGSDSERCGASPGEKRPVRGRRGRRYARLKRIKQATDPAGLLCCEHCVGSDEWEHCACRTAAAGLAVV